VKCDMTSPNSTIIKLGMRFVNVLCHLQVKYYTVREYIGQYDLLVQLGNHTFPDVGLCKLVLLLCGEPLKSVEAF
jgi:hypothetical protein